MSSWPGFTPFQRVLYFVSILALVSFVAFYVIYWGIGDLLWYFLYPQMSALVNTLHGIGYSPLFLVPLISIALSWGGGVVDSLWHRQRRWAAATLLLPWFGTLLYLMALKDRASLETPHSESIRAHPGALLALIVAVLAFMAAMAAIFHGIPSDVGSPGLVSNNPFLMGTYDALISPFEDLLIVNPYWWVASWIGLRVILLLLALGWWGIGVVDSLRRQRWGWATATFLLPWLGTLLYLFLPKEPAFRDMTPRMRRSVQLAMIGIVAGLLVYLSGEYQRIGPWYRDTNVHPWCDPGPTCVVNNQFGGFPLPYLSYQVPTTTDDLDLQAYCISGATCGFDPPAFFVDAACFGILLWGGMRGLQWGASRFRERASSPNPSPLWQRGNPAV